MSNLIRIGAIGCGGRLRGILHRLLSEDKSNQLRITVAWDPAKESLDALEDRIGYDFERAKSEEAVATHPKVDWVFIGSWNCFHANQVIAAMKAEKNVFCEKPLATTLEDCLRIKEAVEKSEKTFVLGLVLRYSPHYSAIRRVLKSGRLGKILSMEFNETLGFNHGGYIFGNWRRLRKNAGTHVLEKCCHDLDLMNWLLESVPVQAASFGGHDFFVPENARRREEIGNSPDGKVAYENWADPWRVDPFTSDADIFDNQVAILRYANGVRAMFHTNCNSAIPERRVYLNGTHGALRADLITGKIEVASIQWDEKVETVDTGAEGGHGGGDEVMAASLLQTLLHGERPLASVREGICSAIAAFGIDQAADELRVVDLSPMWKKAGIDPSTPFSE